MYSVLCRLNLHRSATKESRLVLVISQGFDERKWNKASIKSLACMINNKRHLNLKGCCLIGEVLQHKWTQFSLFQLTKASNEELKKSVKGIDRAFKRVTSFTFPHPGQKIATASAKTAAF